MDPGKDRLAAESSEVESSPQYANQAVPEDEHRS